MLIDPTNFTDQHGNTVRTAKMTTKDVYKLNEGEQILVHVNDRDQLIKDAAGLCTRFITLLLKQPNLCPIEAKDWREVKTRCGVRLMAELRVTHFFKTILFINILVLSFKTENGLTISLIFAA